VARRPRGQRGRAVRGRDARPPRTWDLVGFNEAGALHRQFRFRFGPTAPGGVSAAIGPDREITASGLAHYPRARAEMARYFHRGSIVDRPRSRRSRRAGIPRDQQLWRESPADMDHLKGRHRVWRATASRAPLTEYKKEAFACSRIWIGSLKETAVEQLFKVRMTHGDAAHPRGLPSAPPDLHRRAGGEAGDAGAARGGR